MVNMPSWRTVRGYVALGLSVIGAYQGCSLAKNLYQSLLRPSGSVAERVLTPPVKSPAFPLSDITEPFALTHLAGENKPVSPTPDAGVSTTASTTYSGDVITAKSKGFVYSMCPGKVWKVSQKQDETFTVEINCDTVPNPIFQRYSRGRILNDDQKQPKVVAGTEKTLDVVYRGLSAVYIAQDVPVQSLSNANVYPIGSLAHTANLTVEVNGRVNNARVNVTSNEHVRAEWNNSVTYSSSDGKSPAGRCVVGGTLDQLQVVEDSHSVTGRLMFDAYDTGVCTLTPSVPGTQVLATTFSADGKTLDNLLRAVDVDPNKISCSGNKQNKGKLTDQDIAFCYQDVLKARLSKPYNALLATVTLMPNTVTLTDGQQYYLVTDIGSLVDSDQAATVVRPIQSTAGSATPAGGKSGNGKDNPTKKGSAEKSAPSPAPVAPVGGPVFGGEKVGGEAEPF